MSKKILTESLKPLDMKDYIVPLVGIDEYKSRLGKDEDIITLSFMVKAKGTAEDLCGWLERGYSCIIDAEVSPGEIDGGKYLVFVEMRRRPSAPRKIVEMLEDLETLTDLKLEQWSVKINKKRYTASKEIIDEHVPLTSNEYVAIKDADLNEWRVIAGLPITSHPTENEDIIAMQRRSGIL